jgi:putative DNA primase/helicase
MKHNPTTPKIKSQAECKRAINLLYVVLETLKEGWNVYIEGAAGGTELVTEKSAIEALSEGRLQWAWLPVGEWPGGITEHRKQKYLAEHPHDDEFKDGLVYRLHGKGGVAAQPSPEGWWGERADIVRALIAGRYMRASLGGNIVPFSASPVPPKTRDRRKPSRTTVPEHLRRFARDDTAKYGVPLEVLESPEDSESAPRRAKGSGAAKAGRKSATPVGEGAAPKDEALSPQPNMLEKALGYAQGGEHVFPVWWVEANGRCACSTPDCRDAGKHPLGKLARNGFKDATTDAATIRRWWRCFPLANIGIATGPSKLLVIDLDVKPDKGKDGRRAWQALKAQHGDPGETLTQITPSDSQHLVFDRSNFKEYIKSSDSKDGLDVRADGGYIVAKPSIGANGKRYAFQRGDVDIAPAPEWLCKWASARRTNEKAEGKTKAKTDSTQSDGGVPRTADEEVRVVSALRALPQAVVDRRDKIQGEIGWLEVGMVLHSIQWPNAGALWDEWSMGSAQCGGANGFPGSDKYDAGGQEKAWRSFDRSYSEAKIGLGTLYHHARRYGWIDPKRFYHRTDNGNAQRLVDRHGLNLRYVTEWGAWLVWKDARWKIDSDFEITRLAKETIEAMHAEAGKLTDNGERKALRKHAFDAENITRIKGMIELAKSERSIPISATRLDANPYLIGVQNGVIDLKTFEFREARREDFVTIHCDVHYDPKATCPNWLKFLDTIMDNNRSIIGYLQRFNGYLLTGSVEEEVMQIAWGTGKNGKTTYRETISTLLGEYAVTSGVELLLQKKEQGGPTPEIARLKGRRFVTINETKENDVLSEQRVKYITGNEKITARHLHKEYFDFMPSHKTMLTTNHKPIVKGTDEGIWRRIHLVPFTVTIPAEERDPSFRERYLIPELSGILNWMLAGLKAFYKEGLNPPKEIRAATEEYRNDMDIIGQWLKSCCETGKRQVELASELYLSYRSFALAEHKWCLSQNKFGRRLSELDFPLDKLPDGTRTRIGLKLMKVSYARPG